MRRPVFYFLLAFAGGILLQFYMGENWLSYSLLGACVFLFFDRKSRLWLLILAVLLGSLSFSFADRLESGLAPYEGRSAVLQGVVLSAEEGEDSLTLVVKVRQGRVGNRDFSLDEKVLVRSYSREGDASLEAGWSQSLVGRSGEFRGEISLPSGQRNPNLFDYGLYLKTQGIRGILTLSGSVPMDGEVERPLLHGLAAVRGRFVSQLSQVLGRDDAGLLTGMLFGDRSFLSEAVYTAFRSNGTAHILAVSGIHVGTLYAFVRRLTGGSKRLSVRLFSLALLWFYAALASFSPSVVRAAVMITLHIGGEILLRRYDLLCGASAAALLMLVLNPFYLFDVGFQLSFMAVFSLAFFLPHMDRAMSFLWNHAKRKWPRIPEGFFRLSDSLSPLFAIQVGMVPLMAFHFLSFSGSAFLANPPVLFLAGFLIPLGILLIPLAFLGGPVFALPAAAAGFLSRLMILLNEFLYIPGLSALTVSAPSRMFLVLYYGLVFFFASELWRLRGRRILPLVLIGVLVLSLIAPFWAEEWKGRAEFAFIDVGQGDCLLLRSPSGKTVTIDGGGSQTYDVGTEVLMPYMRKNGVRKIDLALVTHLHDDHYLGISSLAEQFPVERMEMELKAGDRITIEPGVWIDVLYPEEVILRDGVSRYDDENETCLLMKVHCNGVTVLMTGDMGFPQEEEVLELYADRLEILKSDILKVGHHGSKYSTSDAFLEAVDPKAAVIQVGKNNFGHPHEDVIEKLTEKGIMIYRNDLDGAVLVYAKDGEFEIETML